MNRPNAESSMLSRTSRRAALLHCSFFCASIAACGDGVFLSPPESADLDSLDTNEDALVTVPASELGIPTNVKASSDSKVVVLTWNAVSSANLSGYAIYRGVDLKQPFMRQNPAPNVATSFTDTTVTDGVTYYYRVRALNTLGQRGPRSETVSATPGADLEIETPDTTAPTIAMTSPSAGATLAGTATLSASATDDTGVVAVQFFVDGMPSGAEDTTAPFSLSLDTTTLANASHSFAARARDAAGNLAMSSAVSATIANGGTSSPPPPPPPVDPTDLCSGLKVPANDKTSRPMTALAKPGYLQTVVDPQFGTTIRRITNVSAANDVIKPLYTTMPAWNADESYLMLLRVQDGMQQLYNGKTYAFIRDLNDIDPPDVEQVYWHATNPKLLFYVQRATHKFYQYDVTAPAGARHKLLRDFTDCDGWLSSGDDPVYGSWDSNYFSFLCSNRSGGGSPFVFIYRVDTNTVVAKKAGTTAVDGSAPKPPRLGPSGTLALWDKNVTDIGMNILRSISIQNPDEHTNNSRLLNGHDTFNTVIFDPPANGADNDYVGALVSYDLTTAQQTVVIGPKTGYPYPTDVHISAMAMKKPGWILVSNNDATSPPTGQDLLDLELVYADTNTGRVCRLAHHRAWGKENTKLSEPYFAEAHAVPSPSGTRIAFASDWNNGDRVDTYVVELPTYQP